MFIIQLAALAALSLTPVQAAQTQQAVAPTAPAANTAAETRRVCRFETQTGSNRRTRVCRDVPRQGMQDQGTRDFMRDSQRVRMPDANG